MYHIFDKNELIRNNLKPIKPINLANDVEVFINNYNTTR